MRIDPVCGMEVLGQNAPATKFNGEMYYFCCIGCKARFEKNPQSYLPTSASSSFSGMRKNAHTDEAHPDSAARTSGSYPEETKRIVLPIEGMSCTSCVRRIESNLTNLDGVVTASVNLATSSAAIEYDPSRIGAEQFRNAVEEIGYKIPVLKEDNSSALLNNLREKGYHENRRELVLIALLAVPVVVIGMVFAPHEFRWNYPLFVLTSLILFWGGRRFFVGFWSSLRHVAPDMNTLVAVGTFAAYAYSSMATFFPSIFVSLDSRLVTYYDTTAVIITFILFGRLLEAKAKGRASAAIAKLLDLSAKTACVIRGGQEVVVPIQEVQVGETLLVRPGERVPVDGIITEGSSYIDQSLITGESVPVKKNAGDEVIGTTINQSGSFRFEAKRIGRSTVFAQIVRVVEEAQSSKAPVEMLADKVASVFVPIVLLIALTALVGWYFFGPEPRLTHSLFSFVAVLVVACPCALGLATPTAVMVGCGLGAEHGILIKDVGSIENVGKAKTIVLDKTGTITDGKPSVGQIVAVPPYSESDLLQMAASVETLSEHPIGRRIAEKARSRGLFPVNPTNFLSEAGRGASGIVDKNLVVVGNLKYLQRLSVMMEEYINFVGGESFIPKGSVFVAVNGRLAGSLAISDAVKESSPRAIHEMKRMGMQVVMISGDSRENSEKVAREVGIEAVIAGVLPHEKLLEIRKLQQQGKKVVMVGDGINDAPALAQADVGIALGSGSDIAKETGDMILVGGDLRGVISALKLSKRTMKTIQQNLFWAFFYNLLLIPLAAFGQLDPMLAALAMAMSSVSVVGNSLRLRWINPTEELES